MTDDLDCRDTRPSARRPWLRPLLFASAGGLAFAVDMGVLGLLVHGLAVTPTTARGVSIVVATSASWAFNRYLTFARVRSAVRWREWLRYLLVNGVGVVINYGIYALIVTLSRWGAAYPLASVVPGGLLALVINYGLSSRLVFASGPGGAPTQGLSSRR